ncbi:MAG: hypothetical protein K2X87_22190, partial [Gemmataceae bacterium]|nr:hypothetical protein [Gemmataceae bacterium]
MSVALLTTPRQACLDRLAAGDPAARAELVRLSRGRLLEMARRLLDRHPRFRRWGESEDLLQDALVRLDRALAAVPLATTADFLAVAATNIRWALSDLVRRYYGRYGVGANHASPPPDRDGPPPDPADPRPGGSGAPAEYAELLEL